MRNAYAFNAVLDARQTGAPSSLQGDESIFCVELSFDMASTLPQIDLGAEELGGPIVVQATGGTSTLDLAGLVIAVTVTPL